MSTQLDLQFTSENTERRVNREGTRAYTISIKRLAKRELRRTELELARLDAEHGPLEPRPRTWGECQARGLGTVRPCAYVSCGYNLALDVNERTGGIKINHPDALDPEDGALDVRCLPETCALAAIERRDDSPIDRRSDADTALEQIGEWLNISRERVRQIETKGLAALAAISELAKLQDYIGE